MIIKIILQVNSKEFPCIVCAPYSETMVKNFLEKVKEKFLVVLKEEGNNA